MDDAAIDRIINAVEHWGDDPDPVQQAINYGWDAFTSGVLMAYCAANGLSWPGGCPGGKASFTLKLDSGEKYSVKTDF